MDVVGEEDCTDMKTDEGYRPSVLSVKTEYQVSIVMKYFLVLICVCMCFVPCSVSAHNFTCIKQAFLVYSGEELHFQDIDI